MPADSSVELRVSANTLRVINTEVSDGTRAKIQDTMGSAQVLEVERFSEIHFQSTQVEANGADYWVVRGICMERLFQIPLMSHSEAGCIGARQL
jgi:polyisoprenoid-binding protein YceI